MKSKTLEKATAIQILLFLQSNKEKGVLATQLIDGVDGGPHTIYSAVRLLLGEVLIQEEWKINPRRRVFTLTEKGEKIAEKLAEIEEILVKEG